jgi:hypothetical protein
MSKEVYCLRRPWSATKFDSINLWKSPVQQGQSWRIRCLQQFPWGCTILGDLKIEAPFFGMTADKVSIYRGVFRQQNLPLRSLLARLSLMDGNRIAHFDARRNHPWRPASVSIESAQPFLAAILIFRLVVSLLACCLSASHAKCSHRQAGCGETRN